MPSVSLTAPDWFLSNSSTILFWQCHKNSSCFWEEGRWGAPCQGSTGKWAFPASPPASWWAWRSRIFERQILFKKAEEKWQRGEILSFHRLSSLFSSCFKATFPIKVLMELKNLNIEEIYSNKQLNPSPSFPSVFQGRKPHFSDPTPGEKGNWNSFFPCHTRACVSPAVVWKQIWAIAPQLQDGACRAEGGSWGASPPPQGCTEGSAALQGFASRQTKPTHPQSLPPAAWLHFHYVFMMPSASSRNHGSCLALLKYPGKWSNNQITSLTEWQILEERFCSFGWFAICKQGSFPVGSMAHLKSHNWNAVIAFNVKKLHFVAEIFQCKSKSQGTAMPKMQI